MEYEKITETKKYGGLVNELMITINMFYPYESKTMSHQEMVDTIHQIQAAIKNFEKDKKKHFLSSEELCPGRSVVLMTGLAEKFVHICKDDEHDACTFSVGDVVKTSPIVGIHRIGDEFRGEFLIETQSSYYYTKFLRVNDKIKRKLKLVRQLCPREAGRYLDFRAFLQFE